MLNFINCEYADAEQRSDALHRRYQFVGASSALSVIAIVIGSDQFIYGLKEIKAQATN